MTKVVECAMRQVSPKKMKVIIVGCEGPYRTHICFGTLYLNYFLSECSDGIDHSEV